MEHVKYQQPTRLPHSCSCSYCSAARSPLSDWDPEIHAAQRFRDRRVTAIFANCNKLTATSTERCTETWCPTGMVHTDFMAFRPQILDSSRWIMKCCRGGTAETAASWAVGKEIQNNTVRWIQPNNRFRGCRIRTGDVHHHVEWPTSCLTRFGAEQN